MLREPSPALGRLLKLAAVVAAVAVLRVARDVLVPLAVGILFAFLLAPLVTRLERRLGRVLAVSLVVAVAFAALGFLGWVVYGQVVDVADSLGRYRSNIRDKIVSVRGDDTGGPFDRAADLFREIESELSRPSAPPADAKPGASAAPTAPEPIPVIVTTPKATPLEFLTHNVPPLLQSLGTAGIVIIFVIFMLLAREDLRDRIIRLVGYHDLYLTTSAMDEAARRVSSYLAMQFVVNVTYGIPVAVGLALIGVPNAFLWGLLAAVLRYIPYLGPWIAAVPPIVLAFATFPGWNHVLLTLALFVVLELVSNNVVEPWLYGSRTGVSPVALLVAAVFWTWLWGPLGLMLAAPLTVCLVVVGQHVQPLEFLNVLFGDQPAMTMAARLYQRLLARDGEEALDLVTTALAEKPAVEVFDTVLVPALALAERDRHRGTLDADSERAVLGCFTEILADITDSGDAKGPPSGARPGVAVQVLVVAARDEADALVATMAARLFEERGIVSAVVGVQSLAAETLERVGQIAPTAVLVSALPPQAVTHARYLVKRLHATFPDLPVVVGLWMPEHDPETGRERLAQAGASVVAMTLRQAVEQIEQLVLARRFATTEPSPAPEPVAS